MRTIEYGTTTHVPAFLTKLWKLVTDASCDDLISWSLAGTSFIIYDEIRFSKELLPMYFKHNNMASFVRQLNMYGFRKLSCIDQGGMHCYKNEIEFYHQYFLKGQETLLELIKRKIPNSKSEEPKVKQEYIDELISNIKTLRGKQDSAEQGMRNLRRENRMLWRHVNLLTDRYSKQQAVLQQLVPFFMNMVRSSREVALKRKTPLMIDEGDIRAKIARMSPPYYVEHSEQEQNVGLPSSPGNVSNRGPVIHDVTEMESSKMFPGTILCSANSSTTKECEAIVDSPLSCSLESSEQTIDSPYTEQGSMETLNILNHNFERTRSSSISPQMELKHSPTSVCSSPMQMSSQACAMPSSQNSMANFSAVPNGLSPVPIIDESTSDVPIPDGMMRNFVPKIEDTCSDTQIYSVDSMMNGTAASIMRDRVPMRNEGSPLMRDRSSIKNESVMQDRSPIINEGSSMMQDRSSMMSENSMMRERAMSLEGPPPMMRNRSMTMDGTSSMMRERSSMIHEGVSSVMRERSPIMNENSSAMRDRLLMNEGTSTLMRERSSLMNEGTSSMMLERPSMMNEASSGLRERSSMISESTSVRDRPTMLNEGSSSMMNEGSSSMMSERNSVMHDRSMLLNDGSSSLMNERIPMENVPTSSSGNKFLPNGFISNAKNAVQEINWMLNSEAYGNEPNIENWLGQIFKSDNLIAGCSLPQQEQTESA